MCSLPLVAAPAAVTPFSVGKYRRCGRVPSTLRWCGTESTRPRSDSFFSRSRSVEAGNAPEAGQLLHGGQGRSAQQQEGLLKPLAQGAQRGVRPQALQVDDDLECGRFNRPHAPADGAQDGGGHGASHVAPFEESPQGVAGHAEMLGCLPPSMQRRVGAHVVPGPLS